MAILPLVVLLLTFKTLQISFFFASTYVCLIDNFGNFPALLIINWLNYFNVQHPKLKLVTVSFSPDCANYTVDTTMLLSLTHGFSEQEELDCTTPDCAGIAQTTVTSVICLRTRTQLGSFVKLKSTKRITTLQSAAMLVCNILITALLVQTLDHHKTGVNATNSMLNMLMINAINRGVLTAVCAALNMILFLAIPDMFYFFLGLMLSSKFYMNSALATQAEHAPTHPEQAYPSNADHWRSIPINTILTGRTTAISQSGNIEVEVHSETYSYSTDSGKKHAFINGMV
ncbi:hypothetical protein B0H34DRAFT_679773 [Crassisporium funariophilum]|nr:hypothetical protein B0H34DRAFT_679773 [Crassisporium funariophilum]